VKKVTAAHWYLRPAGRTGRRLRGHGGRPGIGGSAAIDAVRDIAGGVGRAADCERIKAANAADAEKTPTVRIGNTKATPISEDGGKSRPRGRIVLLIRVRMVEKTSWTPLEAIHADGPGRAYPTFSLRSRAAWRAPPLSMGREICPLRSITRCQGSFSFSESVCRRRTTWRARAAARQSGKLAVSGDLAFGMARNRFDKPQSQKSAGGERRMGGFHPVKVTSRIVPIRGEYPRRSSRFFLKLFHHFWMGRGIGMAEKTDSRDMGD